MNPYAPYLLASIYITEANKDKYPLGDVIDIQASEEGGKLCVFILTKVTDGVDAALSGHRSFLRKQVDEKNPEIVTYVFGVPSDHRTTVRDCLAKDDYPRSE